MKFRNYVNLSFKKNIVRNKHLRKTKILISFLLIIISISVIAFRTVSNSVTNIENSILYRTLYVTPTTKKIEASKLEHVSDYYAYYEYQVSVTTNDLISKASDGVIFLKAYPQKEKITLFKGSNPEKEDEIICPFKFITDSDVETNFNLTSSSFINLDSDRTISISYYEYIYDSGLPKILNKKNEKLRIVGTYNPDNYGNIYNTCFASKDLILRINNSIRDKNEDDYSIVPEVIVIDKKENVESVINELNKYNYYVNKEMNIDYELFGLIKTVIIIILCIFIISAIAAIIILVKKENEYLYREYFIMKTSGYSNKDILKCIFIDNMINTNEIFIIHLFILSIIYLVISLLKNKKYIVLAIFKINYPFIYLLLAFVIINLSFLLISIIKYNELKLKEINDVI